MRNVLKLSCAAAIASAFMATATYAQTGNGSDISGPAAGALVTFAPLNVPAAGGTGGGSGAPNPGASSAVTGAGAVLSGNTPVISPATNQPIPLAAAQSVGAVITSGSPADVAATSAALQSAGGLAGATATLTNALAALAGATPSSAPGLIIAAAQAFNAFVASAPASFFAGGTLPAQFLAIHAALVPMVSSIQ